MRLGDWVLWASILLNVLAALAYAWKGDVSSFNQEDMMNRLVDAVPQKQSQVQSGLDSLGKEVELLREAIAEMQRQRDEWHNTAEARWNRIGEVSEQLSKIQGDIGTILAESVWAMETIRELIMLKLDRKNQTWAELEKECLTHPYYQHAKRFLARPDVREWQERLKETGETA